MEVVDNILNFDTKAFNNEGAPSQIIFLLEKQLESVRRNFTDVRENIGVEAFSLDKMSFQNGLTFGNLFSESEERNILDDIIDEYTNVYVRPDDLPTNSIKAAIIIPREILNFIPEGIHFYSSLLVRKFVRLT